MRRAVALSFLVFLTGCGSVQPLSLRCTVDGKGRQVQVRLTIRDNTQRSRRVIVYGPALQRVRFVHPALQTVSVVVDAGKNRRAYSGWVVPRVSPSKPAHLYFRLVPPSHAADILLAGTRTVRTASTAARDSPSCTIGG